MDLDMLPQDIIEHIYKLKNELEMKNLYKSKFDNVVKKIPMAARNKRRCWAYNGDRLYIYWGFAKRVIPKNGFYVFKV